MHCGFTRHRDGFVEASVRRSCSQRFPRQLELHLGHQRLEIHLLFLVVVRAIVGTAGRLRVLGCCGVLFATVAYQFRMRQRVRKEKVRHTRARARAHPHAHAHTPALPTAAGLPRARTASALSSRSPLCALSAAYAECPVTGAGPRRASRPLPAGACACTARSVVGGTAAPRGAGTGSARSCSNARASLHRMTVR